MEILHVRNLSKKFGDNSIIEDLSFSVPKNTILGFLGKNGAGKTTTMKMILGLLKPTSGSIEVCGEKVKYGQNNTNKYIGYLPDVPEYYNYMKASEYLKLCAQLTNINNSEIDKKVNELIELVGLKNAKGRIGGYSRGMKQRLGIAQALINDPKLLICDEPTSALDPVGRKEVLDILYKIKSKTTVIFSTHILSDVERICDNIVMLNNGKISISGELADIKNKYRKDTIIIDFNSLDDLNKINNLLKDKTSINDIEKNSLNLKIKTKDIKNTQLEIYSIIIKEKIIPLSIRVEEPTLETLFMEKYYK